MQKERKNKKLFSFFLIIILVFFLNGSFQRKYVKIYFRLFIGGQTFLVAAAATAAGRGWGWRVVKKGGGLVKKKPLAAVAATAAGRGKKNA